MCQSEGSYLHTQLGSCTAMRQVSSRVMSDAQYPGICVSSCEVHSAPFERPTVVCASVVSHFLNVGYDRRDPHCPCRQLDGLGGESCLRTSIEPHLLDVIQLGRDPAPCSTTVLPVARVARRVLAV